MKKRLISILLISIFAIAMLTSTAFARQYEQWSCTGDAVNVRSAPDVTAPSYGYLLKGETVFSRINEDYYPGANYRFVHCPMGSTSISQAYGYQINGYVSANYLQQCP